MSHTNTAKNFVVQLGSLVALYATLTATIVLLFGVINIAFPDEAANYYEYTNAQSAIRFGIAALLVVFPVYLVLTRIVNQTRRKEHGAYLTLTKWLIYLSLLAGGAFILGDLIVVIMTYLNGEITTRFILKALTILVIIGAGCTYYVLDAREYWQKEEKQSVLYGASAALVVLAVLYLGFSYADSPSVVREQRLDQQQVSDLQTIQYRIEEYYRISETMPASIEEVFGELMPPTAPTGRESYALEITSDTEYELCAEFAHPSAPNQRSIARPLTEMNYSWEYDAGYWCFKRTLQPLKVQEI